MLKKLFALSIVFLMLCGCGKKNNVTPVLDNISFNAEIEYGGSEFIADVSIKQDALNLVVSEPQEIKDLTLNVTKNGITANFKGLTYAADINSLPQGAIAQILYVIINDVKVLQNKAICNEDNCEINSQANGYKYEFTFSPSGLPINLKVEQIDLDIDFKNVTLI